jgi:hypothetical protein
MSGRGLATKSKELISVSWPDYGFAFAKRRVSRPSS